MNDPLGSYPTSEGATEVARRLRVANPSPIDSSGFGGRALAGLPAVEFDCKIEDIVVPSRSQLVAQKRNLCNIRAEFRRDIAKLQQHEAAVDAGIQAIDAQIAALAKPSEL